MVNFNFVSSCRQQFRQNDDDAVRSDAAATCAADAVRNHPSGDADTDADACAVTVTDADSSQAYRGLNSSAASTYSDQNRANDRGPVVLVSVVKGFNRCKFTAEPHLTDPRTSF